jgi:hypothetical protein
MKWHDGSDAWHDDGNPRSWDGGAIVARQGRSTLSIAVTGGGLLAQRQRRQREDLATLTSKRSICSRGRGGYDDNDIDPRGDDDNDTTISLAMATATRVAGDKKSVGGKSDGDNEKGCGRATAMATKRAMAAATRAAGDEEGNGKGGESDGDTYKEGDGEEEGEYKGGESDGDGEEDGEGDKGDGDGGNEGDGEEVGEGNCNSVFGAQKKCVSQCKKSVPISWPLQITNHKFAIVTHKRK